PGGARGTGRLARPGSSGHRRHLRACPRIRGLGRRTSAERGRMAARRDPARLRQAHPRGAELDGGRALRRAHPLRDAQGRQGAREHRLGLVCGRRRARARVRAEVPAPRPRPGRIAVDRIPRVLGGDGMTTPLHGLRVIDASTLFAGPMTAMHLGDMGAEVIKVEHPTHPDPARGHGPSKDGQNLWWKTLGRNKRTVAIDLHTDGGRDAFLRLARTADVVVENFRPGTLGRWELGYEQLAAENPGLVLARVTGFGQIGPYRSRPGFGTLAEAMSGFAASTGEPDGPPTLPPFGLADGIASLATAYAIMVALHARASNGGRGQVVDV